MIPIYANKILDITGGFYHHTNSLEMKDLIIHSIITHSDDKSINSLFIALKGKNFDGHFFVHSAIKSGAKILLLNRPLDIIFPQIIVKNTYLSMLKIACWLRKKSKAKVVAITGSAGKTTVKEMVSSILKQSGKTLFNKKNFNNDIGICKTFFNLNKTYKYIVIEIGANHKGEIKMLSEIIKPDSVLVNNLFISHLDGFGSIKGISESKGEIFLGLKENGTAVMNYFNNDYKSWKVYFEKKNTILFFSLHKNEYVDFYARNIFTYQTGSKFILCTPFGCTKIYLSLIGIHNILNSLAASALSVSVGANLQEINLGLKSVSYIPGRIYPIYLSEKKILLDDTYNSNIGSMISAIDVLFNMPGYRILVLSDMNELGKESKMYHRKLGRIIYRKNFEQILTIGKNSFCISKIVKFGKHFNSKKKLILKLISLIKDNKTVSILIKGSRNTKMEEVVDCIVRYFVC